MTITEPAVLAIELERVRAIYNGVRLHEAIGYVTPNDEHEGRGDKIRAARADGMRIADEQRRATRRAHRNQLRTPSLPSPTTPPRHPPDAV